MCGIVGSIGARGPRRAGLDALAHRGPDDEGEWCDAEAGVWLGHRRLSIIDPSPAGHQPMLSPCGRVAMVYNGEIYNYRELRRDLEAAGERFQSSSDSEVLLRLFALEGADCLTRLNGIFAVAFWERDTRTLTLARDPIGVKPLYYSNDRGVLSFASEMKAILENGDSSPQINTRAALRHLGFLWSPGEETIVTGIRKLLPGHVLSYRAVDRTPRLRRYSDPLASLPPQASRLSESDAIAGLRDRVEGAVRRQLVSDVPLGAFLSGGLDSSSIVAFASRHFTGPGKLQCFSIEVRDGEHGDEGFADDLPYARRVAAALDVDLHVVPASGAMMSRLPEMIYGLDEPTPDPAALNTLLISELARSHGVKVLLSGTGGDDLLTGYRRHYALLQERWWKWLPQPILKSLGAGAALLPKGSATSRRLAKAFQYAGLSSDERLASYFLWMDPSRALRLLSPDSRADLSRNDLFAPMLETLMRTTDAAPLERMLYLEAKHFLADHNLNYADKMGMAAGVEIRVPLLDLELVDFARRIPFEMKQRGRTGKWVFKRAMEGILPNDVIYRPKTGFGVPLRQWLRGPLREFVEDALGPDQLRRRNLFDPAEVRRMIDDDRAGRLDASYTIFGLVCLELWCREFIDNSYGRSTPAFAMNH